MNCLGIPIIYKVYETCAELGIVSEIVDLVRFRASSVPNEQINYGEINVLRPYIEEKRSDRAFNNTTEHLIILLTKTRTAERRA